ncbi:MAG: polyphosphate kinase 1 [Ilumatobacteraceae bacterium]|jgi:polyphosphate kinase|nr:polyphosphate kinase 1 [Ilumatobacteraceae bacterium]MDP4929593.1 polyphosphate kinase 1 [Ilumatobacteraceae bacterium]
MTKQRNHQGQEPADDDAGYGAFIDARFINRELSWLDFNDRVLSLATGAQLPLLERVKFLAISSSNLDEFYQVRVAALHDQIAAEVSEPSIDGRTPLQQLREIAGRVQKFATQQERLLTTDLLPTLAANGVRIVRWTKLGKKAREALTADYESRIFPILTPLAVDPSHPFPYISNLALNLAVTVRDTDTGEQRFARVKVPRNFPRCVPVPDSDDFILLEDLIEAHLDRLFPGMEIVSTSRFRVTRNADLSLDDEDAEDLLAAVEMELRRRRFGRAVRLEVQSNISKADLSMMCTELELDPIDVIRHDHFIEFSTLMQLANLDKPKLRFKPWTPVTAGRLAAAQEAGKSMFDVIRSRQLLVHHPYESFASSTETFVEQAARDPKVLSIKMTLYRTSGDSQIARHLIRAAEAGKQVAVVMELKARFDEARNVSWARELELAGVHVNYGLVGLKTHAKCILIVREEAGVIRRYVHLATGNYNSVTARSYEDIGFFTCEEAVGRDATQLFNYLTGYGREPKYEHLLVAPHQLKTEIIRLIENEATFGADGRITLKLNAVQDPQVIEALYAASSAGVKIDLVVRGICCVRAGVPGMSENITVRSVLGRYLEHSRIYRFAHGYDGSEPLHLIGSADLMIRNLAGRVETLVRLTHPKHRAWLDTALGFLLDDANVHYRLGADNSWTQVGEHHTPSDAQRQLFEWVVATQSR